MTVTTEEAELLAQTHDLVRFTLGMKAPEHDLTAAALRSLAAERDARPAVLKRRFGGRVYPGRMFPHGAREFFLGHFFRASTNCLATSQTSPNVFWLGPSVGLE